MRGSGMNGGRESDDFGAMVGEESTKF